MDVLMENIIWKCRSITKTFPGVKALDAVKTLKFRDGENHALVGGKWCR